MKDLNEAELESISGGVTHLAQNGNGGGGGSQKA